MHRLHKLKALFLDVDGVLTDGKVYFDASGSETKAFNTQDGLGLKHIQQRDIVIIVISGRSSPVVDMRMQELGIKHVYQGISNKLPLFKQILDEMSLNPHETAYIGDDLPDLEVMQQVAFPLTVANAVPEIKSIACHIASRNGGEGGVRELCDWLLQNHLQ